MKPLLLAVGVCWKGLPTETQGVSIPGVHMAVVEAVERVELDALWGSKGHTANIAVLRVKIRENGGTGAIRSIRLRYPIDGMFCGLYNTPPIPEGQSMGPLDVPVSHKVNPFKTFEVGTTIEFGGPQYSDGIPPGVEEVDALGISTRGGKF